MNRAHAGKERVTEAVLSQRAQFLVAKAENIAGELEFARKRGEEQARIVGVQHKRHAGVEDTAHRVGLQALDRPQQNVGGDADLQRNVALAQSVKKTRVAGRGDTVADPSRAQLERRQTDSGPVISPP